MTDYPYPASLCRLQTHWELVRTAAKQRKTSVWALLDATWPEASDEMSIPPGAPVGLLLVAAFEFHVTKLREPDIRAVVEWAIEQVIDRPCSIEVVSLPRPDRIRVEKASQRRLEFARWLFEHGELDEWMNE